ncbi:MAG: hypothetical protein ACXVXD_16250 [Nocardioidaceae bacterium]
MRASRSGARCERAGLLDLAGAGAAVAVGVALFTRFGIDGTLTRDEGIYTYSGQQLAHGVPPYASIFDPKAPLATMLAGGAVAVARALGRDDIALIRGAFFVCACLTVLAVYLLAARLFRSPLAGLVAAVVFASFRGFAAHALSGPDAKTPGILMLVVSMWLLTRRSWFWGAFAGSLAFLVWQPLLFYPAVACLVAVLNGTPGRRAGALGRALAGAALPVAATVAYFAAVGALHRLVEAAVLFPLTGIVRGQETVPARLAHIVSVVNGDYGFSAKLFWAGLALLLLLVVGHVARHPEGLGPALRDPLVCVVLLTLATQVWYASTDFQSFPDLYPLLAYPALGLGGAAAAAVGALRRPALRSVGVAGALAALAVLTVFSWGAFTRDPLNDHGLDAQRADACALRRLVAPGDPLYSLGDPAPLALTHRTNPDRFIFLGSGVDQWKVAHLRGGFPAWTAQVRVSGAQVVVFQGWDRDALHVRMADWLRSAGYHRSFVGGWRVLLTHAARERALREGVALTPYKTPVATGPTGRPFPAGACQSR